MSVNRYVASGGHRGNNANKKPKMCVQKSRARCSLHVKREEIVQKDEDRMEGASECEKEIKKKEWALWAKLPPSLLPSLSLPFERCQASHGVQSPVNNQPTNHFLSYILVPCLLSSDAFSLYVCSLLRFASFLRSIPRRTNDAITLCFIKPSGKFENIHE